MELDARIAQLQQETLVAGRNAAQLAAACEDTSTNVLATVQTQGDQLLRIAGKQAAVEHNLEAADASVRRMRYCCLPSLCDRRRAKTQHHPLVASRPTAAIAQVQPSATSVPPEPVEDDVDELVDKVTRTMTTVKAQARALGNELDWQNGLLDDMTTRARKADCDLQRVNRNIALV